MPRPMVRYSPAPDESMPSLNAALVVPRTQDLSESEFNSEVERVKRQQRGVKLAIAKVELEKDRVTLQTRQVELGTAKIKIESAKQDFLTAGYQLVAKRAQTAIAADNAQSAVAEWGLNQDAIRTKISGLNLSVQEAQFKHKEKKESLQMSGMPARLLQ